MKIQGKKSFEALDNLISSWKKKKFFSSRHLEQWKILMHSKTKRIQSYVLAFVEIGRFVLVLMTRVIPLGVTNENLRVFVRPLPFDKSEHNFCLPSSMGQLKVLISSASLTPLSAWPLGKCLKGGNILSLLVSHLCASFLFFEDIGLEEDTGPLCLGRSPMPSD